LHRPELEHVEEPAAAADALAAVEHGPPGGGELDGSDREPDGQQEDPEHARERDVEDAQLEIGAAVLGLGGEANVPADEGFLERWRRRCHGVDARPSMWRFPGSTTSRSR